MEEETQTEPKSTSIYLDQELLKFVDAECKKENRSRNNYIITLIKEKKIKEESKNN